MPDWIRKPGTGAHPLEAVLQDLNGPIGLPTGSTVLWRAKIPGALTPKFQSAGIVVAPDAVVGDPNRGRVRYSPITADLDTPGLYEVDIYVSIAGLGTQPIPEAGYMFLLVLEGVDIV